MTQTYTANDLAEVVKALPAQDHDFALSLVQQSQTRGLTARQQYWVNRLVTKAKGSKEKIDLSKILELFGKTQGVLKRPKILLTLGGQTVRLSIAGSRSRYPGSVTITSTGDRFSRVYYGRINLDGSWQPSMYVSDFPNFVADLQRFAADPATVAAEHGKLTGACSFCNRPLSDKRSTAVGYGPICAQRFGLAWG